MKSDFHKSVFLSEVLDLLQIKEGKRYIDATLGGGGHSEAILDSGGLVLGIDQDKDALNFVGESLKERVSTGRLRITQGNFGNIDKIAIAQDFGKVNGVLFDLGVSSFQIGSKTRGFSFQNEAELDMRMDQEEETAKASDILNLASEDELNNIFTKYGEERRSRAISNAVVRTRKVAAIKTTADLLKIIQEVYGLKGEMSDKIRASVAKRVFQALRIAVNNELENLRQALPKALSLLEPGGRIAVISFHSLEDRIVKESFIFFQKQNMGQIVTKKPLVPKKEEILENPRARSAKLRSFEKI